MTGGKRPRMPEEPEPTPTPLAPKETEAAKEAVRRRHRKPGRAATILAGRLTSEFDRSFAKGKKLLGE